VPQPSADHYDLKPGRNEPTRASIQRDVEFQQRSGEIEP
jgi:hypothetical protein